MVFLILQRFPFNPSHLLLQILQLFIRAVSFFNDYGQVDSLGRDGVAVGLEFHCLRLHLPHPLLQLPRLLTSNHANSSENIVDFIAVHVGEVLLILEKEQVEDGVCGKLDFIRQLK